MKTSIYILTDPRTESLVKCYIGKSNDPIRRIRDHLKARGQTKRDRWIRSLLSKGLQPNLLILEKCENQKLIWESCERKWIAVYRAKPDHDVLNHTSGGEGVSDIDDETRHRMSAAAKRRHIEYKPSYDAVYSNAERNKKISQSLSGMPHCWNKDLPQNQPGWNHTEDARSKIAEATRINNRKRKAEGGYKPHTQETKDKISKSCRGKKPPNMGMTTSDETRRKISNSLTGKPKSDSWKQKASEAAKSRWAKIRLQKQTASKGE